MQPTRNPETADHTAIPVPFISVLAPCYNEERHIAAFIDGILRQDYPAARMEVLLIDRMSTDRTREIIRGCSSKHAFIRLLENDRRFVPHALNLGIRSSSGEVIVRMDVHSEYPANYLSRLVSERTRLNADNTGGVWVMRPSGSSLLSLALAEAQSSVFGVGNAAYRKGTGKIRRVDTVPYGCFPRNLFDRIGMFDEDLLRNQDDEFNARINQNGGSVWLIPDVKIIYHSRPTVSSLCRMFYQYAFFKPLVNLKLKRPATVRQFIPPLFVVFLLLGWVPALLHPMAAFVYIAGICLYAAAGFVATATAVRRTGKVLLIFYLPGLFFLQHLAYGTGYWIGIVEFVLLKRRYATIASSR